MTCPHCSVTARSYHEVNGQGHEAREGCRGICLRCRMWWAYTGGQLVKYVPTMEEQVTVGLEMIQRQRQAISRARLN